MNKKPTIADSVDLYIAERRALGFSMDSPRILLRSFARFADERLVGSHLTVDVIVAWARAATRPNPLTWGRRLEIVRPFALWLRQYEPRTEVPPGRFFGRVHRRLPPHIYNGAELKAMLREAARLTPCGGLRPRSVATIIGLLACTGMRVSEVIALQRDDVVLKDALLVVRKTKFHKSRLVPVHPTTVRALRRYCVLRDRLAPVCASTAFFVLDGGADLTYRKFHTAFCRLRVRLGWEHVANRKPRIHDLRHTFASRRLLRWQEERIDVDRRLLDLSTYLGHAKASDTYWYLSGFPELMVLAARRFECFSRREVHP